MGADYLNLLGLTRDASADEIRTAYFEAARRLHPDTNPNPTAHEKFIVLQEAYEVLTDSKRKAAYLSSLPEEQAKPIINVQVLTSLAILPRITETQLFYAMVEITAAGEQNQLNQPPLEVCLVIDRSTSMHGNRIDTVKTAVNLLIKQLKPRDVISIVTFSDRAEVVLSPTRVEKMSIIEGRIFTMLTGGATEIFQGLKMGYDQFESLSDDYTNRRLILLTDGHTYGDEQACIELAEEAGRKGLIIDALGIGEEWNDLFLDKLTSLCGGNTIYVSSLRQLSHFLEEKLLSAGCLYAKGLTLGFEHDNSVKLQYAFKMRPSSGPLPVKSPLLLGNLNHKESISFLIEFALEALPEDCISLGLMNGYLGMEIPDYTVKKARIPVEVSIPVLDSPGIGRTPDALLEAMEQLSLYRLQEKARQEVQEGKIERATLHLKNLATNLLSRGDGDLARHVIMEAEKIKRDRQYSKTGEKRIKYGTRGLIQPSNLGEKP